MGNIKKFLFRAQAYLKGRKAKVDLGRALVKPPLPSELENKLRTHNSIDGWSDYGEWQGLTELRERLAKIHGEYRKGGLTPEQVIITNGATGARNLYLKSTQYVGGFGRRIFVQRPFFFDYSAIPGLRTFSQSRLKSMRLNQDFDVERWDWSLLVSNPHNPLGTSMSQEELDFLERFVHQPNSRGDIVIDSAYRGFELEERDYKLPKDTWELTSVGKVLGMTDLRIGALIIPDYATSGIHFQELQSSQNEVTISVSQHEQRRALEKLDHLDDFQTHAREHLRDMNTYLRDGLANLDQVEHISGGDAGIHFVKIESERGCRSVAWNLLTKEGIYVMPGEDFGVYKHLRICVGGAKKEDIDVLIKTLPEYIS